MHVILQTPVDVVKGECRKRKKFALYETFLRKLSRAKKRLTAWGAAWEEANAEGLDLEFSEFNEKKGKS